MKVLTHKLAKKLVVGKTVSEFMIDPEDAHEGAEGMGHLWFNDVKEIRFTDGSSITFTVMETEGADYGITCEYWKAR